MAYWAQGQPLWQLSAKFKTWRWDWTGWLVFSWQVWYACCILSQWCGPCVSICQLYLLCIQFFFRAGTTTHLFFISTWNKEICLFFKLYHKNQGKTWRLKSRIYLGLRDIHILSALWDLFHSFPSWRQIKHYHSSLYNSIAPGQA